MTSLTGWLLVGQGDTKSVVLIAYHNESGAFGVCLNDPSDSTWEDVFGSEIDGKVKSMPILLGGPDKADKPWALHPSVEEVEFENTVTLGAASLTLSLDGLSIAASGDFGIMAKIGFGVFQWQPGELEAAVQARDDWQVIPASDTLLFAVAQDDLYTTCSQVAKVLAQKMDEQP